MIYFKNFLATLFVVTHSLVFCQIKANISAKSYNLQSVDITIADVVIQLSDSGEILGFQTDSSEGDVDYYDDANFNTYRFGKLKTIGNLKIDYWDVLDKSDLKFGKIKNLGDVSIDYYDNFDQELSGKVKKVGNLKIDYWEKDIIDNSRYGKLKSIGNLHIEYGQKDIVDSSKFKKIIKFGSVNLDYWNDKIFNKEKFGKLKSVKGNTKDVLVNFIW